MEMAAPSCLYSSNTRSTTTIEEKENKYQAYDDKRGGPCLLMWGPLQKIDPTTDSRDLYCFNLWKKIRMILTIVETAN